MMNSTMMMMFYIAIEERTGNLVAMTKYILRLYAEGHT